MTEPVRVPKEIIDEIRRISKEYLTFKASIADVMRMWPRSPCCNAILIQVTRDGDLICSKCGRKYTLTQKQDTSK